MTRQSRVSPRDSSSSNKAAASARLPGILVSLVPLGNLVFLILATLLSPRVAAVLWLVSTFLAFVWYRWRRSISRWWFAAGLFSLFLASAATAIVVASPHIRGAPRLRDVVSGISVPTFDFSWATNGSVTVRPIAESGMTVLEMSMVLRGDTPGDCGWGIDLMRWSWLSLSQTRYETQLAERQGFSFYVRGARGGETIGVSLKSDRLPPDATASSSDEERISLAALGYAVTTSWQEVRVPFARFTSFETHRPRNIAIYTDAGMTKSLPYSQTIYIRNISFW